MAIILMVIIVTNHKYSSNQETVFINTNIYKRVQQNKNIRSLYKNLLHKTNNSKNTLNKNLIFRVLQRFDTKPMIQPNKTHYYGDMLTKDSAAIKMHEQLISAIQSNKTKEAIDILQFINKRPALHKYLDRQVPLESGLSDTLLIQAVSQPKINKKLVRALLYIGANPLLKNYKNQTALSTCKEKLDTKQSQESIKLSYIQKLLVKAEELWRENGEDKPNTLKEHFKYDKSLPYYLEGIEDRAKKKGIQTLLEDVQQELNNQNTPLQELSNNDYIAHLNHASLTIQHQVNPYRSMQWQQLPYLYWATMHPVWLNNPPMMQATVVQQPTPQHLTANLEVNRLAQQLEAPSLNNLNFNEAQKNIDHILNNQARTSLSTERQEELDGIKVIPISQSYLDWLNNLDKGEELNFVDTL